MQYICGWWFSDSTNSQSIIISSSPSLPKHFGSHFFFGKFSSSNKLITQIFPLFFLGGLFRPTNQKSHPPRWFSDPIVPCQVVLMAPEEFTFLCESFEATWYPHGVCCLLKHEGYDVFFSWYVFNHFFNPRWFLLVVVLFLFLFFLVEREW